ncbi:MAG: chromosome segregation protein SMC, partial [Verrucomicrobiae bacterium]|nr:chromosome segregation protein SMC [Verrucomicrobiae bacterium]
MHLKNLTVFGFKSFADKTGLDFQPGITAIVGPNGCGKSNIADAIRWVLGEQSAKALRGGEMADVIFNGADSRKQLNLAEVSLTIGGVDVEELKAGGVPLEYDEITLTRRVSRDGGSNYYLNKTPCRLKDIQQLFAGTGMGRSSYSIMAQGNITQILSSKPDDRRLVFEEAAGITRFKVQKKEALRKLEHTEQNLLRVADLVREVKRQIISLQRQAGKARRYQKLMGELQHLETQLARHQYDVLMGEIQERQERIEQLRKDIETGSEVVLKAEGELGELRHRLSELEHEISARQQRSLELKADIERHENRIQFNERRLEELESRNAEALAEIEQSEARRVDAEQELAALAGQLETAESELQARQEEQAAKRTVVQSIEAELRSAQDTLRQLNNDVFRTAQDVSRLRNQVSALDLQKQSNLTRLDKLSAEKVQLEEERRQTEQRLAEFARDSEAQAASVRDRRLTLEERQRQLRAVQLRLEELGTQLEQVQREQASHQSRLSVLEQLESGLEGFGAGAQAALKTGVDVLGTLAQRIQVPDGDVTAIEAALGHHLQLVLAEHPHAAREILGNLASQKKGRASIAALSFWHGNGAPNGTRELTAEHQAVLAQQECRSALAVLRADETVTPLVTALLRHTQIAPDLARATAAWEATRGEFEFVTPQGELLSRHGVFTGGASNGTNGKATSILGRKNEIAALRARLAALSEQAGDLGRERGGAQAEVTALQAGLQQDRSELQAQEVALAGRQGEQNALQNAGRVLGQKIETVLYEIGSLRDQQQEGEVKRAEAAGRLEAMEDREAAINRDVQERTAAIENAREQRDEAVTALSAASVEVAKREESRAALAQRKQPLERRIVELRELVTQRRQQIETVLQRRSESTAEMEESRGRIGALRHEREQVMATVNGLDAE